MHAPGRADTIARLDAPPAAITPRQFIVITADRHEYLEGLPSQAARPGRYEVRPSRGARPVDFGASRKPSDR